MSGRGGFRDRHGAERRGLLGALERAWYAAPGSWTWARLLVPAAALYGVGAGAARAQAARRRRSIPGVYAVAVGGLTVGGAGKTSLSRWLAQECVARGARPAVVLRGHGRTRDCHGTFVVPDFEGYPLHAALERGGDEAAAHRAALGTSASVAVDRDRRRAASVTSAGYGAALMILDDGWEQATLRWNELWVALDPWRPAGNGALLPAGPLRRHPGTLREAAVVAFLLDEEEEDLPRETATWIRAAAPSAETIRFRRTLAGTSALGRREVEPWRRPGPRAALLSGVGAPGRLDRFARSSGIDLVSHDAFPDHAAWRGPELVRALERAAGAGAEVALITDKDEPRWPDSLPAALPVRVLRSSLYPLDSVEAALTRMVAASRSTRPGEGVPRP